MKTAQLFESWWSDKWRYHANEKELAEAAWKAALESAEKEPENDPKRIGVEILERALREADYMARESGVTNGSAFYSKQAIEKLMQELMA